MVSISFVFVVASAIGALYFTCMYLSQNEYVHLLYSSAIVGGFLSGGLHALTGSDHMAVLLPLIFGKRWWISSLHGLVWGIGHGITSSVVGALSYSMKSFVFRSAGLFEMYGYIIDGVVGLTLLVIGIMGYYEYRCEQQERAGVASAAAENGELETTAEACDIEGERILGKLAKKDDDTSLPEESSTGSIVGAKDGKHTCYTTYVKSVLAFSTVLLNGCVMGISWDGLPSLAPAMVLEGWLLVRFLITYALGTAATMCLAAGLVGEATCWINHAANINISERLALVSSLAAIAIGSLWTCSAILKFADNCIDWDTETSTSLVSYIGSLLLMHGGSKSEGGGEGEGEGDGELGSALNDMVNLAPGSNDNFRDTHMGARLEVVLSCVSVAAVVAVVAGSTYCEFRSMSPRLWTGSKPQVHQV
jgi:hypothetical protein